MEFIQAVKNRRSIYAINDMLPIEEKEMQEIVSHLIKFVPSAFNSQTARVVVALGDAHKQVWNFVQEELFRHVKEDQKEAIIQKISGFAAGYGTILYFEDIEKIEELQLEFPSYAEQFPVWSNQSSGMLQFAIWTALEEKGIGANLQHYNPLIDQSIHTFFNLSKKWKLLAQMPFGGIVQKTEDKEIDELDHRLLIVR